MSDTPDDADWRAPPHQAAEGPQPDPEPQHEPDLFDGPAQDDPRSPVRKLLDLFALDSEREEGLTRALLAARDEEAAGDDELAEQHRADALDTYTKGDIPVLPAVDGAPPVTAGASGADVQISMPRVPFDNWHVTPRVFPDEFDVPLRIRMADAVASAIPQLGTVPDEDEEEPEEENPNVPCTEESVLVEWGRKVRDFFLELEHTDSVDEGVEDRLSKIKTARALMPVIPEGKKAGMLQRVAYTTVIAGSDSGDVGWMYVEPAGSEYGKWFAEQLKKRYATALEAWKSIPDAAAAEKKTAWGAVGTAAAAIAIAAQEAAPTGINTYDGRVLSWGIGLAAPGLLQKVMSFIVQDPKIFKVFYCCGFLYQCEIRSVKNQQDQYHGSYQIVDVPRKSIVYGDNFYHRTIAGKQKKGEFQGKGFLALKAFITQRELLHMLVQVARDPETRETVLKYNELFIRGAANVVDFRELYTEALYVFIAQVQHNWGIAGKGPVKYAISTMDENERKLPQRPSIERDRAIAKGVVRLVAKVLQEQRFQSAVKAIRRRKYPDGLSKESEIWRFPAATEWGPRRMLDGYWNKLQTEALAQDRSKVEVPGFMQPVKTALAGSYLWRERNGELAFDLGPASAMQLRFEHDDIAVVEAIDDKRVRVRDMRDPKQAEADIDATPH
jgi:hypothetical protein